MVNSSINRTQLLPGCWSIYKKTYMHPRAVHFNELKKASVDCELLLIASFLFFIIFFKGRVYFNQSYDFSRKSLSKYLMDTIKHDIDIFINLAKIVRYGRHWDESCNEWWLLLIIYFDCNFPYVKLCLCDDYKNMSTLNIYCGILSTCHNYKKIIVVDWILCPGEIKDYAIKTKIL
jgi:hypothetical protein